MFNFNKPKISEIHDELLTARDNEFEDYTTRDKTDFGVMLMWMFSILIKFFADYANRLFKNMFLNTAIDRKYVIENALESGYRPRGLYSSKQLVTFTSTVAVTIPKNFQVQTEKGIIYETDEEVSIGTGGGTVKVYATQGETKTDVFVSTGLDNQIFVLNSYPFVEDTIAVVVQDDGVYEKISDLAIAESNQRVFFCHADKDGKAVLYFGNGTNGKVPALNKNITVTYKTGKGKSGNVEDGAIVELVNSLAGITAVTNKRVINTYVTTDFKTGDTILHVKDTSSFDDSGNAYVGGVLFTYTSKTGSSFLGVSGLTPVLKNEIVSVMPNGIVSGMDLETIDEIKVNSIVQKRTNQRIVSEEDYKAYLEKHPSIAWASTYKYGNVIRLVAIGSDGMAISEALKSQLQTEIEKINIPIVTYIFDEPNFVPIDIVIEVELKANGIYDSDEIISSEPLIYKGAKQNIDLSISNYLSPLNYGELFNKGLSRQIKLFTIYNLLNDIESLLNADIKVLSKTKEEAGSVSVSVGSDLVDIVDSDFSKVEAGDYIKIYGSVSGNDGFVKVLSKVSSTQLKTNKTFGATESGLKYYLGSNKDVILTGNEVPQVGSITVIDKTGSLYIKSSSSYIHFQSEELT